MNQLDSSRNQTTLKIGSRRSALAMAQARGMANQLLGIHPHLDIQIVEVATLGDKILDSAIGQLPGKGVFVKEIEEKLLAGDIDLAVHSMKDVPTELPEALIIGAIPERVDPRDVFVTHMKTDLDGMPKGSKIGTGSMRRKVQLLVYRSDFEVVDIRGNIETRLKKAESAEYDGIILAAAGLARMNWLDRLQQYLSCEIMIPAVGQGALGIEVRKDDNQVHKLIEPLNDPQTKAAVQAERAFLEKMGGGCMAPMGAFCRVKSGEVDFQAFHADEDGDNFQKEKISGKLEDAMLMAEQLADRLL
ncbi:MAG: hydroxymethylbilane synthase [Caldithrix sp.]|nr:MAG: hydroxymethylbilane synthase [Caldithrix sp.]